MELLFVRSDVKWLFRGCKSAGNIDNIIDFYKKLQNQEGNFKVEMRNLAQKKVTLDFQMKPIIEEFEKNKIKQINF